MPGLFWRLGIIFTALFLQVSLALATPQSQLLNNEKISLNFHDIAVRELLELLAETRGLNLIVSDEVKGKITLHLQNISWTQAVDSVLAMQGLAKHQQGNILLIGPVAQLAQYNSQVQETQNLITELIPIHYAKASDLGEIMQNKGSDLLSPRGSFSIDPRSNKIWIKDTAERLQQIHTFLRGIDIPARQVHIAARIVHMDQNSLQDLGLKFGTSEANLSSGAAITDPGHLRFAIARLGDNNSLDVELLALAQEGHAEIVAKPELLTENRQSATIESGEEIPYQQGTSSGATNVAFKKAVLSLKVTPEITANNTLLLNLKVNQDQVSSLSVNGVPAIQTQAIETRIMVQNGETIVMGGIFEESKNKVVQRLPFLGSIPIIGKLFSSKETQDQRKELLIFITPSIVS